MNQARKNAIMAGTAFLEAWALMTVTHQSSGNIFGLIFFIMSCLLFAAVTRQVTEQPFKYQKRAFIVSGILGGVLTVAWLWLRGEGYVAEYDSKLFRLAFTLVYIIGLFCLFTESILLIYSFAEKFANKNIFLQNEEKVSKIKLHFLAFPITFACWFPVFLYNYPGIFSPDAVERLEGALGVRPLSNHHSVYHSLLMGFWVKLGNSIFGSLTAGVALLSITQLCVMAFTVSYIIYVLNLKGISKRIQILALVLTILNPYNANYSINMFKDSIFGIAVVLCVCALIILTDSSHNSLKKIWLHTLIYALAGTAIGVLRNNGWYAFVVSIPFLLWLFRKQWKKVFPAIGLTVLIVLILRGPVMNHLDPIQPDMAESLAIPMQQLARVIYNGREIEPEQRELLAAVWDLDQIPLILDATSSDPLKILIRNTNLTYYDHIKNHLSEYASMYIKLGIKYPKDYLDALRDETCGFWFPDNLYGRLPDIEGIFHNELGLTRVNKIPWALHLYNIGVRLYTMVPLYGFIGSPGTLFWLLLLSAGFCIVRGKSSRLCLYLLPFLISCTLFVATPASYEYRYAYYQLLGLPLFLMIPFLKEN